MPSIQGISKKVKPQQKKIKSTPIRSSKQRFKFSSLSRGKKICFGATLSCGLGTTAWFWKNASRKKYIPDPNCPQIHLYLDIDDKLKDAKDGRLSSLLEFAHKILTECQQKEFHFYNEKGNLTPFNISPNETFTPHNITADLPPNIQNMLYVRKDDDSYWGTVSLKNGNKNEGRWVSLNEKLLPNQIGEIISEDEFDKTNYKVFLPAINTKNDHFLVNVQSGEVLCFEESSKQWKSFSFNDKPVFVKTFSEIPIIV